MNFENVFYFKKVNIIGGVETFIYNLSCLYKNFTFFYKEGNVEQIKRLSQNIEVIKYTNRKIKCKRFFCNYNPDIIDNVEAEEYIFIIHCNYMETQTPPPLNKKFTKYIGVSQTACDSFKERTGLDAELIYNPLIVKKTETLKLKDKLYLISATRLTKEKGGERINKLCNLLEKNNIDYEWVVYSNKRYKFTGKNIRIEQPKLDLRKEMEEATFVVQLSDSESFCFTVAESLMLGTPVIITDLPVFKEIGCKHGENAIICDLGMKTVDISMIKNGISDFKYKPPKSNWNKYLNNKSAYNPEEKIKVRATHRLWLTEENLHIAYNQEVNISKIRASELECRGLIERL